MIFSFGSTIACSRKVAPVVFNPVWQKTTQKSLDLAYSNFLRENLSFSSFLQETADWTFFKQKGEVGSGIHPQEWMDHILSYSLEIWISWKTVMENFRWSQSAGCCTCSAWDCIIEHIILMEDDAWKTLLRFYMRERRSMQIFSKWKEKSRVLTCSDLFECSMHAGSWALEEGRFISKSFWAVASLIPLWAIALCTKVQGELRIEKKRRIFWKEVSKKTAMLQIRKQLKQMVIQADE